MLSRYADMEATSKDYERFSAASAETTVDASYIVDQGAVRRGHILNPSLKTIKALIDPSLEAVKPLIDPVEALTDLAEHLA